MSPIVSVTTEACLEFQAFWKINEQDYTQETTTDIETLLSLLIATKVKKKQLFNILFIMLYVFYDDCLMKWIFLKEIDGNATKHVAMVDLTTLTKNNTWKAITIPLPIGEYHILIEASGHSSTVMIANVTINQSACSVTGKN